MVELKVKRAKNIKEKVRGLIGKKKPEPFMFETRFGIHTFGLQFPIDVLILDSRNRVVRLKTELNPQRFFFWNPIFKIVIELPSGTIQKEKITLGSIIRVLEQ